MAVRNFLDSRSDPVAALLGAGGVAALGIVVGLALTITGGVVLTLAGVELTPVRLVVLSLALTTGVGFGGTALGYLSVRGVGLSYVGVRAPSLKELLLILGGYIAALALAFTGVTVVTLLSVESAQNSTAQVASQNPGVLWLLVPAAVFLIGPGEELLFRGIVQTRLREAFGPAASVALAGTFFAFIHVLAVTGPLSARLVTATLLVFPSLVFGTAYELTRNIVVPALIHGFYNATLFSLLYLSLKLGATQSAVLAVW